MFDLVKAYERIKKYPVISFDIFDTLVKRNVPGPKAIFNVVEKTFNRQHPGDNIHGFREKRTRAEQIAREISNREEVTFQQIYDQLDLKPQLCRELKQLEAETELKYCQPNYILKELYGRCVAEGHVVVITSDMYLPREIIVQILDKCGYKDYKKLYLSSEIGLRKHTGNLFDYIIKDLDKPGKEIVHIGDSKRNDNVIPRLKGIKTLYVDRQHLNAIFLNKEDIFKAEDSLFPLLNNSLPKYCGESDLFRWGYEALGPLLLGFTMWVREQIIENKIDKAFFLARDMYLVIEIYRKLYGGKNVEYLEVSRKSLRAAYVKKRDNLAAVFDTMTRRSYTVGEVLEALDIDSTELNIELDLSARISSEVVLLETYNQLNDAVLDVLNSRVDLTPNYLTQMGLFSEERIAIIDIGWHATIQNMLENLIGKSLLGLYFGNTVRSYFRSMETKGYWFSFTDETMAEPYLSMTYILEIMLFPPIGTTIGYAEKDGSITPEYKSYEMKDFAQVEQLQKGALTFVDDFLRLEPQVEPINSCEATRAFRKLAFEPTLVQAKKLADILFEDGKMFNLAASQSLWNYLLHPVHFLRDYKEARWKEGFIKQVVPVIEVPHRVVLLGQKVKHNFPKDCD